MKLPSKIILLQKFYKKHSIYIFLHLSTIIEVKETTMKYADLKKHLTDDIYQNYMNGNTGIARAQIANIYRQGKQTPRATFMQIYSSVKDLKDTYKKQQAELYLANQTEKIDAARLTFFTFLKDLWAPDHQLIASAKDAMLESMLNFYPSKKSQKFTRFIMLKQNFPFLKKMKFLANFL